MDIGNSGPNAQRACFSLKKQKIKQETKVLSRYVTNKALQLWKHTFSATMASHQYTYQENTIA